jgi:hypothetical protein
MMKREYLFLTWLLIFFTSCEDISQSKRIIDDGKFSNSNGNGKNSFPVNDAIDDDDSVEVSKVEIRHLVEPKVDDNSSGGSYVRKLTLPKNYNGLLYLAGINISTLSSRNIKVRFKFGHTSEAITLNAIPSTGPGIIPQTNVEVLVMDLRNRPFNNVHLLYDLFDYNDYTFDGSTSALALDDAITHNRNSKLFCRGLSLENDSTFAGNISSGCSGVGDECKYAYAKVVDKGLVKTGAVDEPIVPTEAQIDNNGNGYYEDDNEYKINRCLPDNTNGTYVYGVDDSQVGDPTITFNGYQDTAIINGVTYSYEGPYLPINTASWEIKGNAVWGPYGIYRDTLNTGDMTDWKAGFDSFLFPRYTQLSLNANVEHLSATTPNDPKALTSLSSNGKTEWMDGCNIRATTVDSNTGEHIGSCNVSAKIEIIAVDSNGNEEIIDATHEVKLQLVKPTQLNTEGVNVLLSSFQSCSSSNACGSDQCCFNKRCIGKDIVSQCIEDANVTGNKVTGESCQTDFECASLCCNRSSGTCAVHDTTQNPAVLCSKPSGDQCIAKEWCQKHSVTRCYIVKTGFDALGAVTCAKRCFTYQEFGDCKNGICAPPPTPEQPIFNETDPNRCNDAIDPSQIELP